MKYIIASVFLLWSHYSICQTLAECESELARLHSELTNSTADATSDSICGKMREQVISAFDQPEVFDYPFASLHFSTITSSDHQIRIFNWNMPYVDGTHKYFCFVLKWDDKKKNFEWTEFVDQQREIDKVQTKFLTPEKWMGTLYYEIIPMSKKGRGDTYTLLGWDGKDKMTTCKVIDAITFIGKKIRIGSPIFETENGVLKRMVLEYAEEVSTSVKYYPKKGTIVMDHLSPKNPLMTGIYADYGPDGSYDVMLLKKGKWEQIGNIDISEFSEGNDKPFYDPRPKRK